LGSPAWHSDVGDFCGVLGRRRAARDSSSFQISSAAEIVAASREKRAFGPLCAPILGAL
jgi:hypothetical protein